MKLKPIHCLLDSRRGDRPTESYQGYPSRMLAFSMSYFSEAASDSLTDFLPTTTLKYEKGERQAKAYDQQGSFTKGTEIIP
jgi:hypothetical protein